MLDEHFESHNILQRDERKAKVTQSVLLLMVGCEWSSKIVDSSIKQFGYIGCKETCDSQINTEHFRFG
jgi:hypothetical protein